MPRSKVRGGRKAHNKRIENRNQKTKNTQTYIQKVWQQEFEKRMEELKAESILNSGDTQDIQTIEEQTVNLSL
jgi:hypothetical protein